MENIIIPIKNWTDPDTESNYKAFKQAVGNIVRENDGYPIELSKARSELYARLPAGNKEKTKTAINNLRNNLHL